MHAWLNPERNYNADYRWSVKVSRSIEAHLLKSSWSASHYCEYRLVSIEGLGLGTSWFGNQLGRTTNPLEKNT